MYNGTVDSTETHGGEQDGEKAAGRCYHVTMAAIHQQRGQIARGDEMIHWRENLNSSALG